MVFDLSIGHDRFGSSSHVQQNGSLLHPQDLDSPMRVAAQRKTNAYTQTYADNQNISFLPAIMSTSNRMHGEFLRLLQAQRETEAHFTAAGMPSQRNQSESFRFKRPRLPGLGSCQCTHNPAHLRGSSSLGGAVNNVKDLPTPYGILAPAGEGPESSQCARQTFVLPGDCVPMRRDSTGIWS